MAQLMNSPSNLTLLRLESHKSFSLLLRITDDNGRALNITGSSFTAVAKSTPLDTTDTTDDLNILINDVGTIQDAEAGEVRFDFQASDLSAAVGEYPFVIVMVVDGYSSVIVKGFIELVANPELSSVGETYQSATPLSVLDVQLRENAQINVSVGNPLPPGYGYISTSERAKLAGLAFINGELQVNLDDYVLTATMVNALNALEISVNGYTDDYAAPLAHTHALTDLTGIAIGSAAPSGGSDGDAYIRVIA